MDSSASDTGAGGDAEAGPPGTFMPEIACSDTVDSVYADPGDVSGKSIGAIIKCAHDMDLTAAQLTAAVDVTDDAGNIAYGGPPLTSGAHVYRVLYRTTRGDKTDPKASMPGYSSALLLLPDTPREGTGKQLPIVVAAHGSRGQAGACAPSKDDPAAQYVEEDFQHLVYPMVGLGFPIIAPDLAGYANFGAPGNPPPTYDDVLDVGRSMLDGARAARNVIPGSLTQQVVITGHSQGGYTALAALAVSDSYGAGGTISAVAVFSPLWLSQRTWAAAFADPTDYAFAKSSLGPVSIWYHYTHSFLLDGPDAALELFDPTKAAAVQSFVNNDCWAASYPVLEEAGTSMNDLFSAQYRGAVTGAAIPPPLGTNGNCNGNALCQTWIDRMTADYPHLDGGAASVPILVWYANNDTTITPDGMQCVFNRLSGDQTNYTLCYDKNPVGHGGVLAENAGYAVDWIAHQTLDAGAPATGNCSTLGKNEAGVPQLLTADGGAQKCNPLVSTN
jgi:hypothetical protein